MTEGKTEELMPGLDKVLKMVEIALVMSEGMSLEKQAQSVTGEFHRQGYSVSKTLDTHPEPQEAWQPIVEFCKEANEGWCWIVHKGRTVAAYRDHQGYFRQSWGSIHNYMTECITFVMAWDEPAPPQETESTD